MRPHILTLLAAAFLLPLPGAQAVGSDLPYGTCQQFESLDSDPAAGCTLQWAVGAAGANPAGAANANSGGWCPWPGSWRFQWGASYNKWTPLYGANSPRQGYSELTLESSDSAGISIGLTWEGFESKLSAEHTVSEGVSIRSDAGVSKVKYQLITWSDADIDECGWDWQWHDAYNTYVPTNYEPSGVPQRKVGQLENTNTVTDSDNRLRPTWSTATDTISADLRYKTKEADECFSNEDKWFGEEDVYSVEASMDFGGVVKVGATRTYTESSTYRYHFDSGCYYMDVLGSDPQDSGLAFDMYSWSSGSGGDCSTDTPAGDAPSCVDPCGSVTLAYVDPCDPPQPCDGSITLTATSIDPCHCQPVASCVDPCGDSASAGDMATVIDPCDPPCQPVASCVPDPCDDVGVVGTSYLDPCDPPCQPVSSCADPCGDNAYDTASAIDPCDPPCQPVASCVPDPCGDNVYHTPAAIDPCEPPCQPVSSCMVDPCGVNLEGVDTAIDPCDPGPVIVPDPCGGARAPRVDANLLQQLLSFLCGGGLPPIEQPTATHDA